MTGTKNPFTKIKLYEPKRDYRSEAVLWSEDETKKFDKLSDLAERLWQIGEIELAQEIEDFICDWQNTYTTKLRKSIQWNIEIIKDEIEQEQAFLYIDDDVAFTNPKADLLDRLENIQTVWEYPKYKDIIKHDDCYFFRDNVLDKRTIRTTQRYWKSNIGKDPFKNQKEIPQRYKNKMKGKAELIKREPIIREYNVREWLKLWNEWKVNETIENIIENTKLKRLPAPTKKEIMTDEEIKTERWTDERRVEFYKKAYVFENKETVDRYDSYEREF